MHGQETRTGKRRGRPRQTYVKSKIAFHASWEWYPVIFRKSLLQYSTTVAENKSLTIKILHNSAPYPEIIWGWAHQSLVYSWQYKGPRALQWSPDVHVPGDVLIKTVDTANPLDTALTYILTKIQIRVSTFIKNIKILHSPTSPSVGAWPWEDQPGTSSSTPFQNQFWKFFQI